MSTGAPSTATPSVSSRFNAASILREPLLGPMVALLLAIIIFSSVSDSFLNPQNVSLILQQSVVVGILAVGQTLIILTSGIDLVDRRGRRLRKHRDGAECRRQRAFRGLGIDAAGVRGVRGDQRRARHDAAAATVHRHAGNVHRDPGGDPPARGVRDLPRGAGPAHLPGHVLRIGSFSTTYGVVAMLLVYLVMWYALSQTSWGKHIYAVGGNPQASILSGIKSGRVLLSVYITTGVIAAIAAWAALGRIPNADPNAYQNANLESITAVVIGGTSLFGGRGGVGGTLVGTLIVGVLRNGLTQAGVDNLYREHRDRNSRDRRGRRGSVRAQEVTVTTTKSDAPVLEARGLVKKYGSVTAINGADFALREGEVLAVIGDNGAGKSSLIKALAGAVVPDAGEILMNGNPVSFKNTRDARAAGIETVYQDLAVVPALDIAVESVPRA